MRFLFRLTFWLGLVLLLLPRAGSHSASDIGVIEAVSAAKSTVSDMRGFCERQPVACAVGTQTAIALGQRAQEGAKFLYDYLNEHFEKTGAAGKLPAGAEPMGAAAFGQDTLLPPDRLPAWRGPSPRREAHLAHRAKD